MKQVLISSLFSLSCLAMPMEEPAYLIGREAAPEPQKITFSSNMAANIMSNMNSMLSGFRVAAVATTTTTSAAPSSTAPGSSDGSSTYITPILAQHNNHRFNHSVKDLTWDNGLANTAQVIAQSCVYAHNTTANGGGYGQNIGAGYYPSQVPAMLTNGMYNGEINYYPGYNYTNGTADPDMSNFARWGHFSQIVWNSTTKVGCYTQYCPNGLANTNSNVRPYFTVCNYSPPGNYRNRFAFNVFAPKGNPTVVVPMY